MLALRGGDSAEVVIASAVVVPPPMRSAWEGLGYMVIEALGAGRDVLCDLGMAAASGHVVRVRESGAAMRDAGRLVAVTAAPSAWN